MRHSLSCLVAATLLMVGASGAQATISFADSGIFLIDTVSAVDGPLGSLPPVDAVGRDPSEPFQSQRDHRVRNGCRWARGAAIFDLGGRMVTLVESGFRAAGSHQAVWKGLDRNGLAVPAGTYVCRLVSGGHTRTMKLQLVK